MVFEFIDFRADYLIMKRLADFFTGNSYVLQEELENICG